MLEKVISGGQTGADRAGLVVAKELGLKTGGMMPLGFRAMDGDHPEYAKEYGMKENPFRTYPGRTRWNVANSDGTVRIATNWGSAGELLTLKCIREQGKPFFDVHVEALKGREITDKIAEFESWLWTMGIKTLNVAGNSERTSPGIFEWAKRFLHVGFVNVLADMKTMELYK